MENFGVQYWVRSLCRSLGYSVMIQSPALPDVLLKCFKLPSLMVNCGAWNLWQHSVIIELLLHDSVDFIHTHYYHHVSKVQTSHELSVLCGWLSVNECFLQTKKVCYTSIPLIYLTYRKKFSLEYKFCYFATGNFAKFKSGLSFYFQKTFNDSFYNWNSEIKIHWSIIPWFWPIWARSLYEILYIFSPLVIQGTQTDCNIHSKIISAVTIMYF